VSFDLYAFDRDLPTDPSAVQPLLEDQGGEAAQPLPSPRMTAFLQELQARWPGLDDDPDGSPCNSWPLWQPVDGGRGCAFNIAWSVADTVGPELISIAHRHGLTIYDPQQDAIFPPGPAPRRHWYQRRRR